MRAIEMTVPAGPRWVRPVRLVAASLAADLGFDVEALEDVRVAVDELCSLFGRDSGEGHLELVLVPHDDRLEVTGTYHGTDGVVPVDALVREILDATTHELELPTGDSAAFRFVRRADDGGA